MRDRVDASACRDLVRLRHRQQGIEDGDARRRFRIAARHLLVRLFVGNERERLTFAARAGRRRHGDQRQHRLRRLTDAPIILHPPAVGEEEIAALRGVHAAAAAEPNDQLRANGACGFEALLHLAGGGIFLDRVEDCGTTPAASSARPTGRHARGNDAWVGDEKRLRADSTRDFADTIDGAWTKITRVRG